MQVIQLSGSIRYKNNLLYINFDNYVNILNCLHEEIWCWRDHTWFVCALTITDTCPPNAQLLYVTYVYMYNLYEHSSVENHCSIP